MSENSNPLPLWIRIQRVAIRSTHALANVGAAIVAPFEHALAFLIRVVFATVERFRGVEPFLVGLLLVLLWPVRKVWQMPAALVALLPESAQNGLAAPLRLVGALWRGFLVGFMRLAEKLNLDGLLERILRWTRPLWYPVLALLGFTRAWFITRQYRQLLWGLPVMLVLAPLAGMGLWTVIRGREVFATQYRVAIKEAREQNDYERVRLFERKLAQLGVSTELTDYQTALVLAKGGDLQGAFERMQVLAPAGEPGYLPAHLWIIEQLVTDTLELPSDQSQRLLESHLDMAQRLGATGGQLDLVRGVYLIRAGKLDEACALLEPLVNRFPAAAMLRMQCNISLQRMDAARRDARMVRLHLDEQARRGTSLSAEECRIRLAAESLLGNLPKAHSLAEQWYALEPNNKDARHSLVELSQQLFNTMLAAPNPNADRLADLLLQAAQLTDDPHAPQQQFASLYRLRANIPVAQQVVDRIVSSARTPAALLEAAGTVAATAGNIDEAKTYLRRAIDKDPANPVALNNLAWLISQDPNGNLDDALAAVNKALAIQPHEIRFRETRGQVLIRLGRWREAIADLEIAANGMPDSRDIHVSLAKAYDALGDRQLARVHREHAGID